MELNQAAKKLRSNLIAEAEKMEGDSGFELAECGPHEEDILVRCTEGSPIVKHIPDRFEGQRVRISYYQKGYAAKKS